MVTQLLLYFKLLINLWLSNQKFLIQLKAKPNSSKYDTTSQAGRTAIAKDNTKLLEQLNNIAEQTNYNGTNLLQKKFLVLLLLL